MQNESTIIKAQLQSRGERGSVSLQCVRPGAPLSNCIFPASSWGASLKGLEKAESMLGYCTTASAFYPNFCQSRCELLSGKPEPDGSFKNEGEKSVDFARQMSWATLPRMPMHTGRCDRAMVWDCFSGPFSSATCGVSVPVYERAHGYMSGAGFTCCSLTREFYVNERG